jgi:hypothetical protein
MKADEKFKGSESEKLIAVNKLKANEAELLQMDHTLGLAVAAKAKSEEEKRSIASENTVFRKLVKTVMQ